MTAITQLTREYIAVNSEGYRIGTSHHNCKISDQTIDAIRDLNEEGLGYGTLSTIFNLPRGTIAKICKYQIRGQTPDRYKTIFKNRTTYRES